MCTPCTDCTDCGTRTGCSFTFAPPSPSPPPPGPPGSGTCFNTCNYASDGDCDDGGNGHEYSACSPCTDCHDCGPRAHCPALVTPPPPMPFPPGSAGCSNTCVYASDGDCDDGGSGNEYHVCFSCTDCADCGPRAVDTCTRHPPPPSPHPPPPGPPGSGTCINTCIYASDGDCDDGGNGNEYQACTACTDCADCGPRLSGSCSFSPPPPPRPPAPRPPPPGPPGSGTCVNSCRFASDGDCDDGGSGHEYSVCAPCTDCRDCGPRAHCDFSGAPPPPSPSPPPPGPPGSGQCLNTCVYAFDGDCDDGGAGGEYSACGPCQDCADCGPRLAASCTVGASPPAIMPPPGPPGSGTCLNTCNYASDGDCDDGGNGHEYSACTPCTDCHDCGPRSYCGGPPPPSPAPGPPGSGLCLNTCTYASDGDCDDGGSGHEYSVCNPCTDCADCGERVAGSCGTVTTLTPPLPPPLPHSPPPPSPMPPPPSPPPSPPLAPREYYDWALSVGLPVVWTPDGVPFPSELFAEQIVNVLDYPVAAAPRALAASKADSIVQAVRRRLTPRYTVAIDRHVDIRVGPIGAFDPGANHGTLVTVSVPCLEPGECRA